MADEFDPVDGFGRLNPVPDHRALEPTAAYAPAQELLARLLGDRDAPRRERQRRRRRRRQIAVGIVAGLVGIAGAAAAAVVISRPADDPLVVACYDAPSLEGQIAGVAPRQTESPVEACAEVWRAGAFAGRGEAPPLVGCVLPSGIAGVFPADDPAFCATLGLNALAERTSQEDQIVGLRETLARQFVSIGCVAPARARTLVDGELSRRGLTDWVVLDPGPYTAERPCATLAFDPAAKTVTFVPLPAPPTTTLTTSPGETTP